MTEQLDTSTAVRRPTWTQYRVQVLIVVAGLIALTPMTWREKTVTNLKPTTWRGLRLELVPAGLLVYLSIALAVAVAFAVLRSGGRWPMLLSTAGVITMAALLLSQPGDTSADFHNFTFVTHYQWSAPPVLSLAFWLVLLAITIRGKEEPLHRTVVFACGIALLVLMAAGWQKQSGPDLQTNISDWFTILVDATWIGSLLLAIPVVLAVALIVLPAKKVATTIVAAIGLTATVVFLLLALPRDFFGPSGEPKLVHDWLPAAYLSLAVWLIALAATVHARVGNRR